jgi:hypothetical protein
MKSSNPTDPNRVGQNLDHGCELPVVRFELGLLDCHVIVSAHCVSLPSTSERLLLSMTSNSWYRGTEPVLFDPEEDDVFPIPWERLDVFVPQRGEAEEIAPPECLSSTPYGERGDLGLQILIEYLAPNHIYSHDLSQSGLPGDGFDDWVDSHDVHKVPDICEQISETNRDCKYCKALRHDTNDLSLRTESSPRKHEAPTQPYHDDDGKGSDQRKHSGDPLRLKPTRRQSSNVEESIATSAIVPSPAIPHLIYREFAETSPPSFSPGVWSPPSSFIGHYSSPNQYPHPMPYFSISRGGGPIDHATISNTPMQSVSSSGESHCHASSASTTNPPSQGSTRMINKGIYAYTEVDGYSTACTTPIDPGEASSGRMLPPPPGMTLTTPGYECDVPDCTAPPFQTQYLLRYVCLLTILPIPH